MSLSLRLNLLITSLFILVFILGTLLVVNNARRAVYEETSSTADLTLSLLELAFTSIGSPERQGLMSSRLIAHLSHLERTRHLRIELLREDGSSLSTGAAGINPRQADAPSWFIHVVEPEAVPLRKELVVPGAPFREIVIHADPTDEISEAWDDSRSLLGLLFLFSLLANAMVFVTLHRWLQPVTAITAALEGIQQGDYKPRLSRIKLPELQLIAVRFNQMADVLERIHDENRRLAQLSLHIQEEERRHLAHELHDELGQSISAIKAVAVSIAQHPRLADPAVRESAATIAEISNHVYAVVRGMMQRLRPLILDELGLVMALQEMVDDWNTHHQEVFCRLATRGELAQLGDDVDITIYRIVQEALTNIVKHAAATEVIMELRLQTTNGSGETLVELEISDNGRGFDRQGYTRGLGLLGMQERVQALNGHLDLDTRPGQGLHLDVRIPLVAREPRDA